MSVAQALLIPFLAAVAFLLGCSSGPKEKEVPDPLVTEVAQAVTATVESRPPSTSPSAPAHTAEPTSPSAATETLTPSHTSAPMSTETATIEPTVTGTPARVPAVIPFPEGSSELGDTLVRPADNMVMVYVPGGTFEMGSLPDSDRFDPHTVTLDPFWIDQKEVTNAQFAAFLNDQGNQFEAGITWLEIEQAEYAEIELWDGDYLPESGKANHPVVEVSWSGAHAYCQWVGGELPTEAKWEYAARGPEGHVYPWGDEVPTCELAQFGGCGEYSTPVGSFPAGASWVGALDMAGNVWELVADWHGAYPSEPQTNPTGPETGEDKMARGGSFMSAPDTLHTAYRFSGVGSWPNFGFRCAGSAPGNWLEWQPSSQACSQSKHLSPRRCNEMMIGNWLGKPYQVVARRPIHMGTSRAENRREIISMRCGVHC